MDKTDNSQVANIFNEMQGDYDDLRDLWYSWLFARLHFLLAKDISHRWKTNRQNVLDIGCGTGFQSIIYASLGANVLGVDIADDLLAVARGKKIPDLHGEPPILYHLYYDFARKYNNATWKILQDKFPSPFPVQSPRFEQASALDLPCTNNSYDHVNCCGSVLSFLTNIKDAVKEISRVLKPGGSFFLELESRWNPDAFWPIIDCLLAGRLGYENSFREAIHLLKPPFQNGVKTQYPFGETRNPTYMDLHLTTRKEIALNLKASGLAPDNWGFIHAFTNLLPSTLLDSTNPSTSMTKCFKFLARIEEAIPGYWPGCSIVVSGIKK